MVFKNRIEAGQKLAAALSRYKTQDVIVYALPRGGVVLGAEVAISLGAPLALLIPRKIGHPASPEFAIGAVTETGDPVWNEQELHTIMDDWRNQQVAQARGEAKRRRIQYDEIRNLEVEGKTAIIVDDGIATGLTMAAALRDLQKLHPKKIVMAVPVAPRVMPKEIMNIIDEAVVIYTPNDALGAIGLYFEEYDQVTDEEVRQLMRSYSPESDPSPLDLAALNSLLATINHFPKTSEELAARAKRLHSPPSVVNFFESIPKDTRFKDKADVMQLSEEIEVIMEDEADQPDEYLRSY